MSVSHCLCITMTQNWAILYPITQNMLYIKSMCMKKCGFMSDGCLNIVVEMVCDNWANQFWMKNVDGWLEWTFHSTDKISHACHKFLFHSQLLTLKSCRNVDDRPCEMPAATTAPEWIIGPSCNAVKDGLKYMVRQYITSVPIKHQLCILRYQF